VGSGRRPRRHVELAPAGHRDGTGGRAVRSHWCDRGLEWPNDVLVGDRKPAGVLAEVAAPKPAIVLGAGPNVTMTAAQASVPAGTSLMMPGESVTDGNMLLDNLLRRLAARIWGRRVARGADALRQEFAD
jgi:biotin-(acetyl-CoA carboxylase) ligase